MLPISTTPTTPAIPSSDSTAAPPSPRLLAARLLLRLDLAGFRIRREGKDAIRVTPPAAGSGLSSILSPELRAEIALRKPTLLVLLDPSTLPLNRDRFALLVASEEPERWTRPGGIGRCVACGRGTVWVERAADETWQPKHPGCGL